MSKIVAIGDIHGELDKLKDLIYQLTGKTGIYVPFVFLGDYVDGGPDSRYVLDFLINAQRHHPNWTFLKGNHEDMMLDALAGSIVYGGMWQWWQQGGRETFLSYCPYTTYTLYDQPHPSVLLNWIPQEHLSWMNNLPTLHETENFIFVHAGLVPGIPAEETPEWERLWLRKMFLNSDYDWGKKVIYGHTVQGDVPRIEPNKIGLDTMHHGHGRISAVILDDDDPNDYTIVQSKE